MADLVNEIISQQAFKQLDNAIQKLGECTEAVAILAAEGKKITFEIKGVKELSALNDMLAKVQSVTISMTNAQGNLNQATATFNTISKQYTQAVQDGADALAQQKLELAYVEGRIKAVTKSIQDGKGNIDANNASLADWTRRQQELKVEIGNTTSAIKSEIKEINAADGSMDRLSQTLGQLREQYRAMSAEERKSPIGREIQKNIKTLDVELKTLDKSIGNSQRNVGNYSDAWGNAGAKLMQFVTRDIFRAVAGMITMQLALAPVIEAVNQLSKAIAESIPGTDAYITKIERAAQATESLKTALEGTGDEFKKFIEDMKALSDAEKNGIDNTIEGLQRKIDLLKAEGVINGEVYDAKIKNLVAENEKRAEQLKGLQAEKEIAQGLFNIYKNASQAKDEYLTAIGDKFGDPAKNKNVQYDIYNKALGSIQSSGLPSDIQSKMEIELNKAYKDNGDIIKVLDQLYTKYSKDVLAATQAIENNANTTLSANKTLQAELNTLTYTKNRELTQQLSQLKEQFRQAQEKEDVDAIDKILNDTRAKYNKAYSDVLKQRAELEKQYPNHELPADLAAKYDRLLSVLKAVGQQEEKNLKYEDAQKQHIESLSTGASLSSSAADIASKDAALGLPDYNKMATALDAQTKAKKDALNAQFQMQASKIADSSQLVELQKQYDEKLVLVDKEAFQQRMGLLTDYYTKVREEVSTASEALINEYSAKSLDKQNQILASHYSRVKKEILVFFEQQREIIKEAQEKQAALEQQLFQAKEQHRKHEQAGADADTLSADILKISELNNAKERARNDELSALQEIENKKRDAFEKTRDAAINFAQEAASAIQTINTNQINQELANLDAKKAALDRSTEDQRNAIEATTRNEVERANKLSILNAQAQAQESALEAQRRQLNQKKAQADKQAAIASIIQNTAVAIMSIWAHDGWNPILAGALTAVAAATGAIQLSAAASAPIPQYKEGTASNLAGTHPGGPFIAGDGYEPEYIKAPGKPGYWSKSVPTLYSEIAGTTVTPMSKFIGGMNPEFASGQNMFMFHQSGIDRAIREQTAHLSKSIDELGEGLGYIMSRNRPIAPTSNVADEVRKIKNLF